MALENILLLSCRSPFLDSDRVYPPLANLYLQSVLKKERPDTKVTVSDSYSLENAEWLRGIDGVGVSIMTPQRAEAHRILDFVKYNLPGIKVFAGGPHVHHYLDDIKSEPWDYLVVNDGERVIKDIVDLKGERIKNDFVTAAEYKDVCVKPERLDNAEYLRGYNYSLQGVPSTTMMTARGCPMKCTFCEDAMTTVRWTPMPVIREELDDIQTLGYKGLYIFDDLFAIAMPKVKPICDEIAKHDFIYRCNGQANFFTKWGEDFAKMLADTGCVEIAFGHETGSQVILDNVRKQTSVEQNYKSVEYARKHGIKVKSFLMLGLPGETRETIAATERFIQEANPDDFQLSIYYPYKGTQIRDAIDRNDKNNDLSITGEGLGAYGQKGGSTESVVRTSALSAEELLAHRDRIVETYHPKSHSPMWATTPASEHFFDTHLKEGGQ